MSKLTISIFGNKIFLEILNELKIFSKFKIKYYDNLDLCVREAKYGNSLGIFFINNSNIDFFSDKKIDGFPIVLISRLSNHQLPFPPDLFEKLDIPFSVLELKKKIVSLIAKNEFKKNSLIKINDYILDKNERKIIKDNLELQLSEKEINFIILFQKSKKPLSRNIILKNVWNYSLESETHTVETHIHRLRKKFLDRFGDANFIKNNNKGYYI